MSDSYVEACRPASLHIPHVIGIGWTHIYARSAIHRLTAKINNVILVGDELGKRNNLTNMNKRLTDLPSNLCFTASDPTFFRSTMNYIHCAGACEEILQFTPHYLMP